MDIVVNKDRKEYIDLAKGVCIIFVMAIHLSNDMIFSIPYIMSFRMPFYFFICGLFVSTKYSYRQFVVKKVNALLVPFIFFSIIALIQQLLTTIVEPPHDYSKILKTILSPYQCINGPLWFLVCLFFSYLIYYFLKKKISKESLRALAVILISFSGYFMSKITVFGHHIILPFFLSTSMTALIFIYMGGVFRTHLNLLEHSKRDVIYFILSLIIFIAIQYYLGPNEINMMWNKYSQPYVFTVLGGISGSLIVIYVCKFIKCIPIVSYIGRYSLIALAVHSIIMPYIAITPNDYINFLILILCLCPIIYICKTYLPMLCAQKPFFRIPEN